MRGFVRAVGGRWLHASVDCRLMLLPSSALLAAGGRDALAAWVFTGTDVNPITLHSIRRAAGVVLHIKGDGARCYERVGQLLAERARAPIQQWRER